MTGFVDHILNAPAWVVLGLVGLIVFAEDALFVGFVIPGETAALLGGVAASRGHVQVTAVIVTVIAAAIIGDTVGYEVGRHLGGRVLRLPIFNRHRDRLERAQALLARRGGSAVFLGRWVAFFRAVMPALAGTARMHYLKFLAFNAAGGIVWGIAVVLAGFLAGKSYVKLEHTAGPIAAAAVAAIAVIGFVVWRVRRRRREHADDAVSGST